MKDKKLKVFFEKGEVFYISAISIAEHRAEVYASREDYLEQGMDYQEYFDVEVEFLMRHDEELIDWATNSMDWEDVKKNAVYVDHVESDFDDEWVNADKSIESPTSRR